MGFYDDLTSAAAKAYLHPGRIAGTAVEGLGELADVVTDPNADEAIKTARSIPFAGLDVVGGIRQGLHDVSVSANQQEAIEIAQAAKQKALAGNTNLVQRNPSNNSETGQAKQKQLGKEDLYGEPGYAFGGLSSDEHNAGQMHDYSEDKGVGQGFEYGSGGKGFGGKFGRPGMAGSVSMMPGLDDFKRDQLNTDLKKDQENATMQANVDWQHKPVKERMEFEAELKQLQSTAGSNLAAAQTALGVPRDQWIARHAKGLADMARLKGKNVPPVLLQQMSEDAYLDALKGFVEANNSRRGEPGSLDSVLGGR